jgi:glycine dehydrogenase subunit 1
MLERIGVGSVEDLFADVPGEFRIDGLDLPPALTELDLTREMSKVAARNTVAGNGVASFLGGGAYLHFIPSTVGHIISRSEYYTAYTPYQPEISQGTLQTMFELQSMVCELTGMDVANAGMYDGASALAEACLMACRVTGRRRIAMDPSVNPAWLAVVRLYAHGPGVAVDMTDGGEVTDEHACLAVQQPAFLGDLIDVWTLSEAAHRAGALYIAAVDPISLGMLTPPGEYGADIAVAEGQSLGWPVNFGGPWLGLFTCREQYIRQTPGRIVGRTTDLEGRTGYVLTLQTREQHIRREKATSNITTNQTLLALGGLVHLSLLGPQGLRETGETCMALAQYAKDALESAGVELLFPEKATFKEFAVRVGRSGREAIRDARRRGVNPGYPLGRDYPGLDDALLVAVTEKRTTEEIDRLVEVLAP